MCVRTSGAESERLGVLRWGRFTRPGTLPSRRRHPARAGTGILSPTASNAPGRAEMSLALQDVPGCEAVSLPGATRTRSYVPDGAERPCGLCRPGSRTYLSIEDCVLLQKVTARAQSFGGEVRPGRRTQSPMGRVSRASSSVPVRAGHEHVGPPCRCGGEPPDGPGLPRGAVVETSQGRPVNLVVVFTASKGARCPRWIRPPVPGHSGIGFAPWLQDDASTPTPAPRPCASGPRSRARPTTNRPELGAVPAPTPPVPLTGPPDVG